MGILKMRSFLHIFKIQQRGTDTIALYFRWFLVLLATGIMAEITEADIFKRTLISETWRFSPKLTSMSFLPILNSLPPTLEGACWVMFTLLTFYLVLWRENINLYPHLLLPTHTQTTHGHESVQAVRSALPMKVFWVTETVLLSFPHEGDIYAGSMLFQCLLPVLGQHSQNSLGGLRTLRGAIWSISPFLLWEARPISSTELPPFVSIGSEHPNWGTYIVP